MTTQRPVLENLAQQLLADGKGERNVYRRTVEATKETAPFDPQTLSDGNGQLRDDVLERFHNDFENIPTYLQEIGVHESIQEVAAGYSPDNAMLITKGENGELLTLDGNIDDAMANSYSVQQVQVLELPAEEVIAERIVSREMDLEAEIERQEQLLSNCKSLDDLSQADGHTISNVLFGKDGFYGAESIGLEEGNLPEVSYQDGMLNVRTGRNGDIEMEMPDVDSLERHFKFGLAQTRADLQMADPKLDPAMTQEMAPEQERGMER